MVLILLTSPRVCPFTCLFPAFNPPPGEFSPRFELQKLGTCPFTLFRRDQRIFPLVKKQVFHILWKKTCLPFVTNVGPLSSWSFGVGIFNYQPAVFQHFNAILSSTWKVRGATWKVKGCHGVPSQKRLKKHHFWEGASWNQRYHILAGGFNIFNTVETYIK